MRDDAWIHLTIDEQPLGEPAPKIVRGDIPTVLIAGVLGGVFGSALDDGSDAAFGDLDE